MYDWDFCIVGTIGTLELKTWTLWFGSTHCASHSSFLSLFWPQQISNPSWALPIVGRIDPNTFQVFESFESEGGMFWQYDSPFRWSPRRTTLPYLGLSDKVLWTSSGQQLLVFRVSLEENKNHRSSLGAPRVKGYGPVKVQCHMAAQVVLGPVLVQFQSLTMAYVGQRCIGYL